MKQKNEGHNDASMSNQDGSLQINTHLIEHQELVQLYIHEDSMAWRFNFGFFAMNAALFAAIYALA
jgi:hypothetical protein